jgi:dipeptidyl aminopeptidase/acylaminoacyl peptidase
MMRAPFSPVSGDPRVLTRANQGGFRRPVIWNPCTGQRQELLFADQAGDILPKGWSPDGRQILLEHLDRAVQSLGIYDLDNGSTRWLDLPAGVYGDAQFGTDGRIVAQWQDLSHPPRIVAMAADTGKLTPLLPETEGDAGSRAWQSITFPSSDGQEVQAWLALPEGVVGEARRGPFPTIIEAHGGPEEVQRNGYHPEALAWLEQGFAFASVNYRGSTTFGKGFQDRIKGDWGHWELENLAACRRYLVDQGIADPGRIFLTGYCYGGYLTLLALGKQPELWRGGLVGAPIADWRLLYADTSESARQMALAYFGGSPEECPDRYRDCSPATYVQQVRAPIFIWMGRQDRHVPVGQVEAYVAALRGPGKTAEAAWYTGGHSGPLDMINDQVDIQALQLEFVQNVIMRLQSREEEKVDRGK